MPTTLYHLAYRSTACPELDADGLLRILEYARAKNNRLQITGLLLIQDRQIMQFLEGPAEAVKAVYAVVERDTRHRDVTLLAAGPLTHREFPDWAMALTGQPPLTGLIPPGLVDASRKTYLLARVGNFRPTTTALVAQFLGPAQWLP